jgi:hypothetical protein
MDRSEQAPITREKPRSFGHGLEAGEASQIERAAK